MREPQCVSLRAEVLSWVNQKDGNLSERGNQGYTESGIYGIRDIRNHGTKELGMFEAGADFGGDSDEDLDDAGAVGLDGVGLLGG